MSATAGGAATGGADAERAVIGGDISEDAAAGGAAAERFPIFHSFGGVFFIFPTVSQSYSPVGAL